MQNRIKPLALNDNMSREEMADRVAEMMVASSDMDSIAMSVRYIGALNWRKNKEWYIYDKERKRFILTPKAPPEARRSFELFKEANHVTWDD